MAKEEDDDCSLGGRIALIGASASRTLFGQNVVITSTQPQQPRG